MKSPAFQFYAQDFLVGTMLMSAEAVGAYIRLLSYQWVNGGVPSDPAEIRKIGGCKASILPSVLQKFEASEDGTLRNPRLEIVRKEQEEYRAKQAANGRKGGRPSKAQQSKQESGGLSVGSVSLNPNESPSPSSSPSPSIASKDAVASGKPKPARKAPLSDDEWMEEMRIQYSHLDVAREAGKARAWLTTKPRRKFTRSFFVGWLNRADDPAPTAAPQMSEAEKARRLGPTPVQKLADDFWNTP